MSLVIPDEVGAVSLSGETTLLHLCQQELLDLAAICRIAGSPEMPSLARITLERLAASHDEELVENEKTRAATLSGEISFLSNDLARRSALLPELGMERQQHRALREMRATERGELARLEAELLTSSHRAELKRAEQKLSEVRAEQATHAERAAGASIDQPGLSAADEARLKQIAALQRRRDELAQLEETTFAREETLRKQWITRTVAGFLLWLGYASVMATGSVLALIMSGSHSFEIQPLLAGVRGMSSSIFPSWPQWVRMLVMLVLVVGLFRLVVAVFIWFDDLLRTRWKWHEDKGRPNATTQMAPQLVSTRTYLRFVALMPFAFAVALVLSIAGSTTDPAGVTGAQPAETALLTSIFPSLGYSFIGITVSFLATAVFVMYFVRIMQPRAEGKSGLRTSWEFAVPPVLLVLALVLMPIQQQVAPSRWIPWAAFMLASSIALAAGLVFHGIFKDARRAHDRLASIERKIHVLEGTTSEEDEEEDTSVSEPLERRRSTLERILARLLGPRRVTAKSTEEPAATTAEVAVIPRFVAPEAMRVRYSPADLSLDTDLIPRIEIARARCTALDEELADIERRIASLEPVLSFQAMSELHHELQSARAQLVALPSRQEERRRHARMAKELLALKVAATEWAATSIDPLIANVRDSLFEVSRSEGASS